MSRLWPVIELGEGPSRLREEHMLRPRNYKEFSTLEKLKEVSVVEGGVRQRTREVGGSKSTALWI